MHAPRPWVPLILMVAALVAMGSAIMRAGGWETLRDDATMLGSIALVVAGLFIPVMLLGRGHATRVRLWMGIICVGHLSIMLLAHHELVTSTELPIVLDSSDDVQKYYYWTRPFHRHEPFDVTVEEVRTAISTHSYGYFYVMSVLWTLTDTPVYLVRLLKVTLFLIALAVLFKSWCRSFGERLAFRGLLLMGVLFTPAFYYNYRNLKDGLLLSLMMLCLAFLDDLLQKNEAVKRTRFKHLMAWLGVAVLISAIFTIRTYAAVAIVLGVLCHLLAHAPRLSLRSKTSLLIAIALAVTASFWTGQAQIVLELGREGSARSLTLYRAIQAIFSPLPWNPELHWALSIFYTFYWFMLPCFLVMLVLYPKQLLNWKLVVLVVLFYTLAGPVGDPLRKRVILFPILFQWLLVYWQNTGRAWLAREQPSPSRPPPARERNGKEDPTRSPLRLSEPLLPKVGS